MSLLCCLRARPAMGAALSHPQEGEVCDGAGLAAPPTMADVIRERKKKAGGAALGTLRRRLANATRRPRDPRPDRGCEHARYIRSIVSSWRLADVFLLCEELEAGAALRDLVTQAELAREPARALHAALARMYTDRWWCDVEVVGAGWSLCAHRAILSARSDYFRDLLQRYPPSCSRVPLEGACASLSREEADAALLALYSGGNMPLRHCRHHNKYTDGEHADGDLDLVDNTGTCRSGAGTTCACAVRRGAARRGTQLLAVTRDPLATSMRYLLDSGEMADAKLVFRLENGPGAAYGFRTGLELPCHRVVLAARSRFFRSVMSRRSGGSGGSGGSGAGGAVCVDEKVLPRRFARALLHAAYTDQVDLSLIGRSTSLPGAAGSATTAAWAGVARGGGKLTAAGLDDAFQLYEIARFVEMPIVVQGCEDAIAEALSAETLPIILRWASAPHASQWVYRQAMRYLRDEFVSILSSSGAASIPGSALAAALASPFLQASEPAALRALLKWGADHKHKQREPNVVWHTAHSVSRRGARRRSLGDAALRDILAPLVHLVRTEHMPRDTDLLHQLVRRGIIPPPANSDDTSADAWLGRGANRPARCFLPYLDEIKALLAEQTVPEAEIARARRARFMQRIPDTLYMVAAGRASPPSPAGARGTAAAARACLTARLERELRARARELRAAPAASVARDSSHVHKQIALRAVREMSLPDACADLLIADMDDTSAGSSAAEDGARAPPPADDTDDWPGAQDCCRSSGSLRLHDLNNDNSRSSSCGRRDQTRSDTHHSRSLSGSWSRASGAGGGAASAAAGRLSACVPDVAMAPNANTHLLTARDYFRHPPPWECGGVVLQLDLGDGATHTPRPGSRAQRNSAAQQARPRDAPVAQAISCLRARSDEDELRAAIELSVMRAYSSFQWRGGENMSRRGATLPPCRGELQHAGAGGAGRARRAEPSPPPPRLAVARSSPSPSPRRRHYRAEGGQGEGGSSRPHSPHNYA